MTVITSLPIELLGIIFEYVSQLSVLESKSPLPSTPNRTSFPFNVASVCTLWCEILKSCRRYWQHLLIDLADDPRPFLSVLALHDSADISVSVISTLKEPHSPSSRTLTEDEVRQIENTRAQSVFECLKHSMGHCTSIRFQVIFQSSLPFATDIISQPLPRLSQLYLDCAVYDMDDRNIAERCAEGLQRFRDLVPSLRQLSLSGRAFMEFVFLGEEWINDTSLYEPHLDSLAINHLSFPDNNSFASFIQKLDRIKLRRLSLSNMSLTYLPSILDGNNTFHWDDPQQLTFDNVDGAVISAFLSSITVDEDQCLCRLQFKNCLIPPLSTNFGGTLKLELADIKMHVSGDPGDTGSQHVRNESLCNAILELRPEIISLTRCEGVNSNFIQWLPRSGAVQNNPGVTLLIYDCGANFTSGDIRRELFDKESGICATFVSISGKGPPIEKDDAEWFLDARRSRASGNLLVNWNVEVDRDYGPDYITDLSPSFT